MSGRRVEAIHALCDEWWDRWSSVALDDSTTPIMRQHALTILNCRTEVLNALDGAS